MGVNTQPSEFMTVKSNTPATPKATTPKKRRARKTSTTAAKKPPVAKVTTTTFKSGKVISKKSEFTRPSTARHITWERYQKDILTRWQIHQYEVQELVKDFSKGIDTLRPYHAEMVKNLKAINF